ncbi:hypothetical protein HK104_003671 [Borealophlyctis nickersoniae]|nr:hypothetical protein HK104_003671 [Borealophlyctis nickersoniae]
MEDQQPNEIPSPAGTPTSEHSEITVVPAAEEPNKRPLPAGMPANQPPEITIVPPAEEPTPPLDSDSIIPKPAAPSTPFARARHFCTTRRGLIGCGIITLILFVILVPVFLVYLVPRIAQHNLDASTLHLDNVTIKNATADGFEIAALGRVDDAGRVSATVHTVGPCKMSWISPPSSSVQRQREVEIGMLEGMPDIDVDGLRGRGDVKIDDGVVRLVDKAGMTEFVKFAAGAEKIVWRLVGSVTVKVFGMRLQGLKLDKQIVMKDPDNYLSKRNRANEALSL